MKAFVFPGQGSQHKGMGGELFDEFPEITAKADEILGYSIKDLCLNDPRRELGQTQFTQPALYTVNALTYLERLKTGGSTPDYVAGHSLGEYDALFAAGAFDFETGLRLVKKRGELMSLAAGGGMAAVVGMTVEGVEEVLRENNLNTVDIANINAPSQTVLAGPRGEIERIAPYFDGRGMYIPLNVSGAFHSRLMEASGREFEAFIDQFSFSDLTIPVISNVHARPYRNAEVKDNLVKQITSSVKWTETIRYLMGKGEVEFEEVGPGNVLTKLVGTIREEAEPLIVEEGCAEAAPGAVTSPIEGAAGRETEPPRQGPTDGYSLAPSSLGSAEFRKDYNLSLAYLAGAMYRGISSVEMVVKLGKAGMMGFFGAGGLSIDELEGAIRFIRKELSNGEPYGVNLLHDLNDQEREELKVDVFLDCGVRTVEASGYLSMTPALIRYRAHGLKKGPGGTVEVVNRVIAKVSRPEVAESFLSPAPKRLVDKMVAEKRLTEEQARLLCEIPMADDICVEADSGGHTDGGVAYALMPAMLSLRDAMAEKHGYAKRIRVGAAGGIGSPEAAAAAFVLGADFILTGSINQCTVEASINDVSKDLLQQMNVQDTEYAASGDMFELGGKIQVLKRGVFFPARANKLYELYRNYDSIDEIDEKTKTQIQEKYFKCGFDKAYEDAKKFCSPKEIEKAERNPKSKMALIFRWYFRYSSQLTFADNGGSKVDYQIHCGPSLGAFNRWVAGTELESWRNRHVDQIGEKLMDETAKLLSHRFMNLFEKPRLFNRD